MKLFICLLLFSLIALCSSYSFTILNDSFVKDGIPFTLLSGSIHYSRVRPIYWRDRLERVKAMGLNAISVYVPWNFHEESQGQFQFEGDRDLVGFLDIAHDLGLVVLLRPGPYICGEWDFGGFPAWLLSVPDITLRTYDIKYLNYVKIWWDLLLPIVQDHIYSNGGPIVMVQVENEFGSYGSVISNSDDKKYMEWLVALAREHLGNDVILYTTDGGNSGFMERGSLPGDIVYTTGDFGPGGNAAVSFAAQKKFNAPGKSPNMCSEYYTGWLTHWGENIANTSSSKCASDLDKLLSLNGNVNLYMVHGGTNFEFWSGANGASQSYQSTITSYDYNSPISEDGSHGYGSDGIDKFVALQNVLTKYPDSATYPEPQLPKITKFPTISFSKQSRLLDSLTIIGNTQNLVPDIKAMEMFGQNSGLILYTTTVPDFQKQNSLMYTDIHDRVQLFLDGQFQATSYRSNASSYKLVIEDGKEGSRIDFLVEAMGRVNFGKGLFDPKGITEPITWNGNVLHNFNVTTIPLGKEINNLVYEPAHVNKNIATFYKTTFNVATATDTYLNMQNWGKGIVWINGFNIGRYWNIGPQDTLYVPVDLLANQNEIIILELDEAPSDLTVSFSDVPIWKNNQN